MRRTDGFLSSALRPFEVMGVVQPFSEVDEK